MQTEEQRIQKNARRRETLRKQKEDAERGDPLAQYKEQIRQSQRNNEKTSLNRAQQKIELHEAAKQGDVLASQILERMRRYNTITTRRSKLKEGDALTNINLEISTILDEIKTLKRQRASIPFLPPIPPPVPPSTNGPRGKKELRRRDTGYESDDSRHWGPAPPLQGKNPLGAELYETDTDGGKRKTRKNRSPKRIRVYTRYVSGRRR